MWRYATLNSHDLSLLLFTPTTTSATRPFFTITTATATRLLPLSSAHPSIICLCFSARPFPSFPTRGIFFYARRQRPTRLTDAFPVTTYCSDFQSADQRLSEPGTDNFQAYSYKPLALYALLYFCGYLDSVQRLSPKFRSKLSLLACRARAHVRLVHLNEHRCTLQMTPR